jgi:hypothetical protein
MKAAVLPYWTGNRYHFVYMVELYPGNKWVPEKWQEVYVLGSYKDPNAIWRRLDEVTQKVSQGRIAEKDRHVIPNWVFVLIL